MCGTCSGTPENCTSCSEENRDFNNNCECKDGYRQEGLTNPFCRKNANCLAPEDYILEGSQATHFGSNVDMLGPGPVTGSVNLAMKFNGIDQYKDFG